MNELDFKNKIIESLRETQKTLIKYKKPLTEEYIRGYVMGAEAITGITIPSHWYEEIINELL